MSADTLAVIHARKQGAADGFQEGWHGALERVCEGDSAAALAELVPEYSSPKRIAELQIALAASEARQQELYNALNGLRRDANRLCDRQLGGSYEQDCRLAIKVADEALGAARVPPPQEAAK